MKTFHKLSGRALSVFLLFELLTFVLPGNARAGDVGLVDGLWVMKKTEDRYTGDDVQEDLRLSLWRTLGGKAELVQDMDVRWMKKKFGTEDRLIVLFLAPKYAVGVTLLSFIKPYLDDERWIFFPEGPIIRRIRAADEYSNFMGTDFTYYDLSEREPDEENHKLLRIEKFQGVNSYVVETTPKGPVGPGYARKLYWVDSERFIKLRIRYYHPNGRFWKQYDTFDWQKINDIWTPLKVTMEDYMREHKTVIDRTNVRYNQKVDANFFQPQYVDCVIYKDGAFALIPFEQRPTKIMEDRRKARGGGGTPLKVAPKKTAPPPEKPN